MADKLEFLTHEKKISFGVRNGLPAPTDVLLAIRLVNGGPTSDDCMHPLWPNVSAFHPHLWRAVCGYELNPAMREELLQEVLLAIWESLPRLREADSLLPFVLRIAHNLGASHVRAETRMPSPVPFDGALHDVADPATADACTCHRPPQ